MGLSTQRTYLSGTFIVCSSITQNSQKGKATQMSIYGMNKQNVFIHTMYIQNVYIHTAEYHSASKRKQMLTYYNNDAPLAHYVAALLFSS